jgi:hypothetical protein
MTLPAGVLSRRVFATYLKSSGDAAVGRVRFTPARVIAHDPSGTYIMPEADEVFLSDTGYISTVITCTDSPHLRPLDWVWICEEFVEGGRRFAFKLPYGDGSDIALTALDILEFTTAGQFNEYVRLDQAGQISGYAPIDSTGHVPAQYLPSFSALAHGAPRVTLTYTTGVLGPGESETGSFAADRSAMFTRIELLTQARVRLYTNTAARDADITRAAGTDPTGNSGLMLDFVGLADLPVYDFTPAVLVSPDDDTANIPITVTNVDPAFSGPISVTLTFLAIEGGLPITATTAYKGTWAGTSRAYAPGDIVYWLGSSYVATGDTTGQTPGASSAWGILVSKGDTGTTGSAGPVGPTVLPLSYSYYGTIQTVTGSLRLYNDTGRTLTFQKIRATCGIAPTGSAAIVNVKKNGTPITLTGDRATIAPTALTATTTTFSVPTIADGEYITIDVDQVGSTFAGSDLVVSVVATS